MPSHDTRSGRVDLTALMPNSSGLGQDLFSHTEEGAFQGVIRSIERGGQSAPPT